MSQPFLGEIRAFGYNFAPRGWALCNGQLLSISQNTALFALLGTQYGGNGTSNFALPNLQGRVVVGAGPNYVQGQTGGAETVTLTTNQLPAHSHTLNGSSSAGNTDSPTNGALASGSGAGVYATAGAPNTAMQSGSIGTAGGSQAIENRPPYLAINYCIAMQGIFPSRS